MAIQTIDYQEKKYIIPRSFFLDDDGNFLEPEKVYTSVEEVAKRHEDLAKHYVVLKERYNGLGSTIRERVLNSGANNKMVLMYEKKLIDTSTGYNTGKPPVYSIKPEEDKDGKIENVDTTNPFKEYVENSVEDARLSSLWKNSLIYGHTYELVFGVKGEEGNRIPKYVERTPETVILIHDDTVEEKPYLSILINKVFELKGPTDDVEYQVYSEKEVLNFDKDGNLNNEETEDGDVVTENIFERLPVIEFMSNSERMSLIEIASSPIDAYTQVFNDKLNTSEYFSEPIMVITDVNLAQIDNELRKVEEQYNQDRAIYEQKQQAIYDDETLTPEQIISKLEALVIPQAPEVEVDLTKTRSLYTKSSVNQGKPKIEFLEKPSNDATQENTLKRLKEDIYAITGIPEITRSDFGSRSGRSIEFEMLSLNYVSQVQRALFTEALKKRLELVSIISDIDAVDYLKNVTITFVSYIPSNDKELAETLAILNNVYTKDVLFKIGNEIVDESTAKKSHEKVQQSMVNTYGSMRTEDYVDGEGKEQLGNDGKGAYAYSRKKGTDNKSKSDKEVFGGTE